MPSPVDVPRTDPLALEALAFDVDPADPIVVDPLIFEDPAPEAMLDDVTADADVRDSHSSRTPSEQSHSGPLDEYDIVLSDAHGSASSRSQSRHSDSDQLGDDDVVLHVSVGSRSSQSPSDQSRSERGDEDCEARSIASTPSEPAYEILMELVTSEEQGDRAPSVTLLSHAFFRQEPSAVIERESTAPCVSPEPSQTSAIENTDHFR